MSQQDKSSGTGLHPSRTREPVHQDTGRGAYCREYRKKNHERILVREAIYHEKNRDRILSKAREWKKNNPDKARAIHKRYYLNNREKVSRAQDKWNQKNREKIWAYGARLRKIHAGFDVKFTRNELAQLALKHEPCQYCGAMLDYGLGKGEHGANPNSPSLDRIENQKGELLLKDIQIICHRCNSTKRDRSHSEFVDYCEQVYKKFKGGLHDQRSDVNLPPNKVG